MEALVYHAGALGDFLAILPTLRVWRRHNPAGRVTLLGRPVCGELARSSGLIDAVWDVEGAKTAPLFHNQPLPPPVAARLQVFASALVFAAPDSPLMGHLQAAGILRIFHQPPFPADHTHIIDYHLSLLGDSFPVAPEAAILLPEVPIAPEAGVLVPEPEQTVLLHAGSGSLRKNWPFGHFYALAGLLKEQGLQIKWLHGPAEPELPYPPGDAVLRGLPLPILRQLLAICRLYVGNDSGISHLAVACRCPAVVLFGASDPRVWAPRGREVTILTGSIPCAPCHPHAAADLARCRRQCLAEISVAVALKACQERLGHGAGD